MKRDELIEQGTRLLSDVREDEHFKTVDGRTLRSVRELVLLLETFSDEHFRHHVNEHRNDFAAWVENSVGDPVLADRIRDATTPQGIQRAISKRLAGIESQLLAFERGAHVPVKEEPVGKASQQEIDEEAAASEEIDALVDDQPVEEEVGRDDLLEEIENAIAQAHAQLQIEQAQERRATSDLTGEPETAIETEADAERSTPRQGLFSRGSKDRSRNAAKKTKRVKPKRRDRSTQRSTETETTSAAQDSSKPSTAETRVKSDGFSLKDFFMGFAFGAIIGGVVGAIIGMMILAHP